MKPIFTFWSFAPFTYVERVCLASWVAAGHEAYIYSFDEIADLPAGVVLKDAAEIVSPDRIVKTNDGNYAIFGDIFRYEGLRRGLGIWCDADILLLRPLDYAHDHIFAWSGDEVINNAVLHLPPGSAFIPEVLKIASSRVPVPFYWSRRRKLHQVLRGLVGLHRPLSRLNFQAMGPLALTAYARQNGLLAQALPQDVFYPLPWHQATLVFSESAAVESYFTGNTRAVHLWNKNIKHLKFSPPPPGSFLAGMCERYAIETTDGPH